MPDDDDEVTIAGRIRRAARAAAALCRRAWRAVFGGP